MLAWRDVEVRENVSSERIWGPVLEEEAKRNGCDRAAASVVIVPQISTAVKMAAVRCVPAELLPRAQDTPETLASRLGASPFLDDAHVLNGGNGRRGSHGKRRRLNESLYPAPRRKSWSVEVKPQEEDADGETVVHLLNYSAYGRTAEDVRATQMPLHAALHVVCCASAQPSAAQRRLMVLPSSC